MSVVYIFSNIVPLLPFQDQYPEVLDLLQSVPNRKGKLVRARSSNGALNDQSRAQYLPNWKAFLAFSNLVRTRSLVQVIKGQMMRRFFGQAQSA